VWMGKTSGGLLRLLPKLHLSLIDRWCVTPKGDSYFQGSRVMSRHPAKRFQSAFNKTLETVAPFADRVKVYKLESAEASEYFEEESLDFIFIDGDHSFEGVTRDLTNWVPKVKKDGLICGHDWENANTYQDVKNAVLSFFGKEIESRVELSYNNTWFLKFLG